MSHVACSRRCPCVSRLYTVFWSLSVLDSYNTCINFTETILCTYVGYLDMRPDYGEYKHMEGIFSSKCIVDCGLSVQNHIAYRNLNSDTFRRFNLYYKKTCPGTAPKQLSLAYSFSFQMDETTPGHGHPYRQTTCTIIVIFSNQMRLSVSTHKCNAQPAFRNITQHSFYSLTRSFEL